MTPESMNTALIDKVENLLLGGSVDGYEIYVGTSKNLVVEVKEQKVDTFRYSAPIGVAVRVIKAGGVGFSFSTSMEAESLAGMVANALVSAETQTPDEYAALPLPKPYPQMPLIFDEKLLTVSEEEKIACAMAIERAARSYDQRVKRTRKASYGESVYDVGIRNSFGVSGYYSATTVTASITVAAEEKGDSEMGWDYARASSFTALRPSEIGEAAAARAVALLGAKKVETMRVPVVLDTHVATDILEVLSASFLAENVQKGKSMLAGRLGEELFSRLITIRDDGTLVGGAGTSPFDGEGFPHRDTKVVDNGSIATYLYDCRTALKDRCDSTGNCTRGGIKAPPRMGITNFFIENGSQSQDFLVEGIERGLIITDVLGMHTANSITGDFSVGASGFFIEKGKRAFPVKSFAISGNILQMFKDVEMVASDLRFYGSFGAPSLLIKTLDVSGR